MKCHAATSYNFTVKPKLRALESEGKNLQSTDRKENTDIILYINTRSYVTLHHT